MLHYIRAIFATYIPLTQEDFDLFADEQDPRIAQLLVAHNKQRSSSYPLTLSGSLMLSAQNHANWMARTQDLSHDEGWDGPGLASRVKSAGYSWSYVGENIACGAVDVSSVMEMWMDSYWHKVNILDYNYKDVGFGIKAASNGYLYWCVDFGAKIK